MAHIYKANEWQGSSGRWYVADTESLENNSAAWWVPSRVLGVSASGFVLLLRNKFQVKDICFRNDFLSFTFDSQTQARKYKNYINKVAREKQYIIN